MCIDDWNIDHRRWWSKRCSPKESQRLKKNWTEHINQPLNSKPFEIWTSKSLVFKCFRCSDPQCMFKIADGSIRGRIYQRSRTFSVGRDLRVWGQPLWDQSAGTTASTNWSSGSNETNYFCLLILCSVIGFVTILFKARYEEFMVWRIDIVVCCCKLNNTSYYIIFFDK